MTYIRLPTGWKRTSAVKLGAGRGVQIMNGGTWTTTIVPTFSNTAQWSGHSVLQANQPAQLATYFGLFLKSQSDQSSNSFSFNADVQTKYSSIRFVVSVKNSNNGYFDIGAYNNGQEIETKSVHNASSANGQYTNTVVELPMGDTFKLHIQDSVWSSGNSVQPYITEIWLI